ASKIVRKYYYEAVYDYLTNASTVLQSRLAQAAVRAELQNGDGLALELADNFEQLDLPFQVAPGVLIPQGGYGFKEVHLLYNFGPQRPLSANVTVERGQFYNGTRTGISTGRGRIQISPQITLEPGVTLNIVRMPEGDFT